VLALRQGAIIGVDEGLDLVDEEVEVRVG